MPLAQMNVGTTLYDLDDPRIADFMDNLDRVNALAESTPGFLWRLTGEGNNATDIKPSENPRFIVNMSVWASMQALFDFVYKSDHRGFMVRRRGSNEVIGNCGVFHSWRGLGEDFDDTPEAGWILSHDQVGQGLGLEAMTAALGWFDREHGPRRTVCMTAPENEPSMRLAGKLGFAPMRDAVLPDGDAVRLFERLP
jgi:RimJ/RimL family protein N-acetyltransferase